MVVVAEDSGEDVVLSDGHDNSGDSTETDWESRRSRRHSNVVLLRCHGLLVIPSEL